ncbi:MAG TPA: retropepsin-like aspartic protease [Kofleriaceae bacterium]|nr:retropepsin-like aspartic protease [Kofleriaceae bacterium]
MLRLVLVLAVIACRPPPPEVPGGARAALQLSNGHWLVRVHGNGQPLTFVVDTAASISAVRGAVAARLGVAATGHTIVNGRAAATTTLDLAIGGVPHRAVRVAVVDLPELAYRPRVDGILGIDVLSQHDIVLDLHRRQLALHPRGSIAPREMTRVPIERTVDGLVVVQVTIAGDRYPAVLDLGSPNSYLSRAAAAHLNQRRETVWGRTLGIGFGDAELVMRGVVVEDLPNFRRFGLGRPVVLLGSTTFRGRTVAISFADRAAYLSP